MGKNLININDEQLDLFSVKPLEVDILQNVEAPKGTLSQFDEIESVPISKDDISDNGITEVTFRSLPSVQVGDNVKVSQPIDDNAESEGYFGYHKGRKGIVLSVTENGKPLNGNYQFSVKIEFSNGEEGVFYDLELQTI